MPRCATLGLLAALTCTSACHYGVVLNAGTGNPESGVSVGVFNSTCSGAGCSSTSYASDRTDSDGFYRFDGYGDFEGNAQKKAVVAASGHEAMRFNFAKRGFRSTSLYHRTKWIDTTYNGQNYLRSELPEVYLCGTLAPDGDSDGLCDAAEAHYGTSPTEADTDGDGFSDGAEILGLDGVDLRYFGASPLRKDVFVEVDYMPGYLPNSGAIDDVVAAFAAAPLINPDGSTGISLHVDVDDQIAEADRDDDLSPAWTDFDVIKGSYFPSRRTRIFHYALFAKRKDGDQSSGTSRGFPASDFMVTLGTVTPDGGTRLQQAGTFMHELGHNLGLRHGGSDGVSYKPHYFSLMNYNYQVFGLRRGGEIDVLDYSRIRVAAVDEQQVQESLGFSPGPGATSAELADYQVHIHTTSGFAWLTGNANINLDMDRNGRISSRPRAIDLNGENNATEQWGATQNDWDNLDFGGGGIIGDVVSASTFSRTARRLTASQVGPCFDLGDL